MRIFPKIKLIFYLLISSLLINCIITSNIFNNQESQLKLTTIKSLKEVTSNLYMINYVNNYYLDDLLKFGNKDVSDLVKFAKLKLGDKYDFNIHKQSKGFACSS